MNVQISPHDPGVRAQIERDGQASGNRDGVARSRRRRWLIGLLVVAALAAFVWFLVQRATAPGAAVAPTGPPSVSVMVPGLVPVADSVSAVGSIAARDAMPVGVSGEGGQVTRVRVEAGQYVNSGQVLAEIDSGVQRAQLAQLEAGVAQAAADASLAQSELDRALGLVKAGFISKADIDRRTATRDSARARVVVAQAQVRESKERIARLAIRAPKAGLVLERNVATGQIVSSASGALYTIAAGGQTELRAQIAEQDLSQLRVGQTATVTPVGSANRYAGTVWLLEPVIDAQSRLGAARIALPSVADLRVGGFANVVIDGLRSQRPLVPQSAIQSGPEGSHVLIVGPNDVVERRVVELGTISDSGVAIVSGLTGRERVVISAGAFLRPGEKVKPILAPGPSDAAAPVTTTAAG